MNRVIELLNEEVKSSRADLIENHQDCICPKGFTNVGKDCLTDREMREYLKSKDCTHDRVWNRERQKCECPTPQVWNRKLRRCEPKAPFKLNVSHYSRSWPCPCPIPENVKRHGSREQLHEYFTMPDTNKKVGPYRKWYAESQDGKLKPTILRLLKCYNTKGLLHGPDIYWLVDGKRKIFNNFL